MVFKIFRAQFKFLEKIRSQTLTPGLTVTPSSLSRAHTHGRHRAASRARRPRGCRHLPLQPAHLHSHAALPPARLLSPLLRPAAPPPPARRRAIIALAPLGRIAVSHKRPDCRVPPHRPRPSVSRSRACSHTCQRTSCRSTTCRPSSTHARSARHGGTMFPRPLASSFSLRVCAHPLSLSHFHSLTYARLHNTLPLPLHTPAVALSLANAGELAPLPTQAPNTAPPQSTFLHPSPRHPNPSIRLPSPPCSSTARENPHISLEPSPSAKLPRCDPKPPPSLAAPTPTTLLTWIRPRQHLPQAQVMLSDPLNRPPTPAGTSSPPFASATDLCPQVIPPL